ncbi:MAG: metallophosphoesterase [bacterium]
MRSFNLALWAGGFTLVLSLLQLLLLRVFNTVWWRKRWVKLASLGLMLTALASGLVWAFATYHRDYEWAQLGALVTAPAALFSLVLVATLPLSGIVNTVQHFRIRRRRRKGLEENVAPKSLQRRRFVQRAAAVIPVTALGLAGTGMARSFAGTNVREIDLAYADLPHDLEGLRILHLSDSHLGPYIDLDDLEAALQSAKKFKPDLLLYSGDIADDLRLLPGAIKLCESFGAPLGAYACMGNHDYYRGAPQVIATFERTSVPMLINRGVTIKVGKTDIFVGGADDPRYMGRPINSFMQESVDQTLDGAPQNAFKIIMSHRPTGFDRAAEQGVDLTLAGHTHGGQIGLMGRPILNQWGNERYIWGKYSKGASQIYTSAGVGHWFPFRLGCPTEAPVLVLKRA